MTNVQPHQVITITLVGRLLKLKMKSNGIPVKFRFYPSLTNTYARFIDGKVSKEFLLDRINRVPIKTTASQQKGISFEMAVIKGLEEEAFDAGILQKVRALLPRPMVKSQVYCEYRLNDVLIYGYVDVIGKILAVDIKTSNQYVPGQFEKSHQNFYLPALSSKGIRSLRYVITDFTEVYQENYKAPIDLSFQEMQIEAFCDFIMENLALITDKKIYSFEN